MGGGRGAWPPPKSVEAGFYRNPPRARASISRPGRHEGRRRRGLRHIPFAPTSELRPLRSPHPARNTTVVFSRPVSLPGVAGFARLPRPRRAAAAPGPAAGTTPGWCRSQRSRSTGPESGGAAGIAVPARRPGSQSRHRPSGRRWETRSGAGRRSRHDASDSVDVDARSSRFATMMAAVVASESNFDRGARLGRPSRRPSDAGILFR